MGLRENIDAARKAGFNDDLINQRLRTRARQAIDEGFPATEVRSRLMGQGVPEDLAFDIASTRVERAGRVGRRFAAEVGRQAPRAVRAAGEAVLGPLRRAREAATALERRVGDVPIPGAAAARAALERGPEFGEEIARLAAERGERFPALQGIIAGAPTTLAAAVVPTPQTVREAALTAGLLAAGPAAARLAPRLPVVGPALGAPLGAVGRRLRQRIFGVRPGEPIEVIPEAAPAAPRPIRRGPLAPKRPAQPPAEPPAATEPPTLPAPAAIRKLGFEAPIRGPGFETVPVPTPRRVFQPLAGETQVAGGVPRQTFFRVGSTEAQSAVARKLGLQPEAERVPGAPARPAAPRPTKKRAAEILRDKQLTRKPEKVAELAQLREAGKLTEAQADRLLKRLTDDFTNSAVNRGPTDPRTIAIRQSFEAFGGKPPRIRETEAPVPKVAPTEPKAPAAKAVPEQDIAAAEARVGAKLHELTAQELAQRAPDITAEIHKQAIRNAVNRFQPVSDAVVKSRPELEAEFREQAETMAAAEMAEIDAAQSSGTPALDEARAMKLNKSLLEQRRQLGDLEFLKRKGVFVNEGGIGLGDLTERLFNKGIIPDSTERATIEALSHEAQTGRPLTTVRALEGQIPEIPVEPFGAIMPPEGGEFPRARRSPTLDELDAMSKAKDKPFNLRESFSRLKTRLKRSQVDHQAELEKFVLESEKKLGRQFSFEENAYIQGQLLAGAPGIVEAEVMRFEKIIRPVSARGLAKDLDKYLTLRQFDKRVRDLQARATRQLEGTPAEQRDALAILQRVNSNEVNPRGFNRKKVERGLQELRDRMADKDRQDGLPVGTNFRYLEQNAGAVWQQLRDILVEARKAGLISQEGFKAIEARGLDYTPIEVLEFTSEDLGGGSGVRNISTQFNDVVKRMEGTTKDVRGSLAATYDKIGRSIMNIERNKVAQKIVALREIPGNEDLIVQVQQPGDVPPDMEPFFAFFDGKRQVFAIPKGLGQAVTGWGSKEAGLFDAMLRVGSAPLRAGATALNLEFAIPNLIRDVGDFMLLSPAGLRARTPADIAKLPLQAMQIGIDLAQAMFTVIGKGKEYQDILKSRALFSTLQKQLTPEQFISSLKKRDPVATFPDKIIRAIPRFINILEETVKVASFKRLIRMGFSEAEAAFLTRRLGGSPDFGRKGTLGPSMSQLFPFYNPGMQGAARNIDVLVSGVRVPRITGTGPQARQRAAEESAKLNKSSREIAMLLMATIAVPETMRYLWNQQFDEYHDLPVFEKDRNFILMMGFNYIDRDGETKPAYLRFPKPHVARPITSAMEATYDAYFNGRSRRALELALDSVTSFSPVNVDLDTKRPVESFAIGIVSSLNPAIKAPLELVPPRGYKTFQQVPLTPQSLMGVEPFARFKRTTPEVAKIIGKAFAERDPQTGQPRGGVSPLKIQQFAESFGAGVAQQAFLASDAILRRLKVEGVTQPPAAISRFEQLQSVPVLRRFIGRQKPRPEVLQELAEEPQRQKLEEGTARFLAANAIVSFIDRPTTENRDVMNRALREADNLEPGLSDRALEAATKELMNQRKPEAVVLFNKLSKKGQEKFLQRLSTKERGDAMFLQLFSAFRRNRIPRRQ